MVVEGRVSGWREAPGRGPGAVRVRMLGGFSVSVGSRTVEEGGWRLRKAAALVKLLALAPNHRVHREWAMELLWSGLDEEAAANNLSQALHVARRSLEPDPSASSRYLRLREDRLELCPEGSLWVDVEAFEEAARAARRTRDPAAYSAALDLYAGDLLPGDLYEGWTEDRRENLCGDYLNLLVELTGLYEESGQFGAAIETLKRAVTAEPTHEQAHAGLVRLYALAGERQQALEQYERLREALSREFGLEPEAESRRLHEDILAGRFPPEHPPRRDHSSEAGLLHGGRHNLPAARTSFIGRERETLDIKRTLSMTRLLTLTGAGGSGKTRLALEVARDLAGSYPDGVWLVELAGLSEPELVTQTVAAALKVHEQAGRPLDATLADHLRTRDLLLVLDNCEHLIYAAAHLIDDLLSECPKLRVLATSREALNVAGETNRRVPSLSLPDPRELSTARELSGYESVRLFADRARHRDPAFSLTPANAEAVAQICRWLGGIPLAIELAAARVRLLSAGQIARKLEDSLKLLTSGSRTAPPRHRTLKATLDWSYRLLDEPEKKLFDRLSVFAGGWTLAAAEAVGADDGPGEDGVLDLLSQLVDKSLVVTGGGGEDPLRYGMLEPVRQYAREQLEESGEAWRAREQHAEYYLTLAEEAEPKLVGAEQAGWLERLETEHGNLRAVLRWLLEKGEAGPALRLVGALGEFWRIRGHLREGQGWLEAALAIEEGKTLPERLKALNYAGWLAWNCLDFERTTAASQELLALARRLGDEANAAAALHHLGMVAIYEQMEAEKAWALFEESLRIRRELGDEVGAGYSLHKMGLILVVQRDFGRAREVYEECLALSRKTGDEMSALHTRWLGGLAYLGLGDHEKVEQVCEEGIGLAWRIGNLRLAALILYVLAASIALRGRPVRAGRLWGAAESFLDSLGLGLGPAERYHYAPYIAAAREQLDEAAWEASWVEGRAITLEEAIEYALSEGKPVRLATAPVPQEQPPADKPPEELTRREEEVAALVARRLTNRQIAEALSRSRRTVDNHVRNILRRLNLSSRSQVAVRLEEQRVRETDRT